MWLIRIGQALAARDRSVATLPGIPGAGPRDVTEPQLSPVKPEAVRFRLER